MKIKMKLKKPHTHGGKDYRPGDTIEVREGQAIWLERLGIAEKKEKTEKGGK